MLDETLLHNRLLIFFARRWMVPELSTFENWTKFRELENCSHKRDRGSAVFPPFVLVFSGQERGEFGLSFKLFVYKIR